MSIYLLRRLNLFLATTMLLFIVVFWVSYQFPGERSYILTGISQPSPEQMVDIEQTYALDSSAPVQFLAYTKARLSGDFGLSVTSQQPVFDEMMSLIPASLELGMMAIIVALALGLPLGVIAAQTRNKLLQNTILALTLGGYSIPVFWLGITLSLWFGLELNLVPVNGRFNLLYPVEPVTGFLLIDTLLSDAPYRIAAFYDALAHLVLPTLTLALLPFTMVVRITRAAMVTVMEQNYIKAAEARGLSALQITLRHSLPNAMLPVLRTFGLMLGTIGTYAIITEVIFSWPGIGAWLVSAIFQRDYPAIQGGVLVTSMFIIFSTITVEVIHHKVNPSSRKELYGIH
ncbi:ABC transporter permease subunit [Paraferrimonas sedimenticola]|uniref:Antimicrobial peptide ABC transporter permease SapB n=1 Tax=Paraferrimonas sedimenticola TaxID=375674 RepID=A0AA37VWH9_9GAMM|nr:ABC transporter permease subunit [Paraferrimonas sedimenticola]GLP94840.1 antimicrobial peptide ABC transporter permease SapB [Paraferrimonas sedimenticola]